MTTKLRKTSALQQRLRETELTMLPIWTTTAYRRYMQRSGFLDRCFCFPPPGPSPKSSFLGARKGPISRSSGNATKSSSFLNPLENDIIGDLEICWNRFRWITKMGGGVPMRYRLYAGHMITCFDRGILGGEGLSARGLA